MERQVMAEPAEQIAVVMLRATYAHLPVSVVAGAIEKARLEPMADILTAVTVAAYDEGLRKGIEKGRYDLGLEMEADWTPVAQRVRDGAGSPSRVELELLHGKGEESAYHGGPVEKW